MEHLLAHWSIGQDTLGGKGFTAIGPTKIEHQAILRKIVAK